MIELLIDLAAHEVGLPLPDREHRFAALRVGAGRGLTARLQAAHLQDWRFDYAFPDVKIAIEYEGGTWSGGRHTRGEGYSGDCAKYNAAVRLGWRVLRYTADMLERDPHRIERDLRACLETS